MNKLEFCTGLGPDWGSDVKQVLESWRLLQDLTFLCFERAVKAASRGGWCVVLTKQPRVIQLSSVMHRDDGE